MYRRDFTSKLNGMELTNNEEIMHNLLWHAYRNVPYYEKIFNEIGLVSNNIIDMARFNQIPVLTKELIRKNWNDLLSKDLNSREWYYNTSGGSTGEPIKLVQDDIFLKYKKYVHAYYYKNILCIDEKQAKKVLLWGSEKDIIKGTLGLKRKFANWIDNVIFLNSFKMNEEDMDEYVHRINKYKPEIIRSYAGSLFELCKHIEKKGLVVFKPKCIVTSAEVLSHEMRTKIESVFGAKVYNYYGSREVNGIAGECKDGFLHIFSFWNHIEILDDNGNATRDDREGKVVVTNLYNYSMPLIRYQIGDMATRGACVCKCGNHLPILSKITGRLTDHFIKTNGTMIHGEYFTHLFYLKNWVKQFQVIQEDYKTIVIKIVKKDKFEIVDKIEIENRIKLVMGDDSIIRWEFLDQIPTTVNGKYLYTKSLVEK